MGKALIAGVIALGVVGCSEPDGIDTPNGAESTLAGAHAPPHSTATQAAEAPATSSPPTLDAGATDASEANADAAAPPPPPLEEDPAPPPPIEEAPPPLSTMLDDPGPPPTSTCSVTKDANGFFTHGSYVAYVPPGYDGTTPARLLVGLHGCGDNAKNFATWAVAPWDTRSTQSHIGISIGGKDGKCWSSSDEASVLAAIADISSCFWVHQQKIVIGGYSSGGEIAYRIAMRHTDLFAGLLVEDAAFYTSTDEGSLLASAPRKLPIAHVTHRLDLVFPLLAVQGDWTKITNAGFPITTSVVAGDHNGTSADWNGFLIPAMADWQLE